MTAKSPAYHDHPPQRLLLNFPDTIKRAANPHLGRRRIGAYSLWDQPGAYLGDFLARASADWHHREWDFRKIIAAGVAKVHLDVLFTRYRSDKHSTQFNALLHDRMPVCSGAVVACRSSFDSPLEGDGFEPLVPQREGVSLSRPP